VQRRAWILFTPLVIGVLTAAAWSAAVHARIDWNLPSALLPFRVGSGPAPSIRRSLLIILVDGLRADEAKRLSGLQRLAAEGASADLWIDGPTFSSPQYVALLTGVPPIDSGIRNNSALRLVGLDSLPAELRAQGRSAFVVSDEVDWWSRLFGSAWDGAAVIAPGELVRWVKAHDGADLVLAHLCGVDGTAHRSGAASAAYHAAAGAAGEEVEALARAWLRPGRAVAVLSDHGHVAHGGHGGDEPDVRQTWMVLAGDGVQRGGAGGEPSPSAVDVAPTLAALVGVPAPGTAEGRLLTGLLDVDARERERLAEADEERLGNVGSATRDARARAESAERRGQAERAAALLPVLLLAALTLLRGGAPARRGARVGLIVLGTTALAHALLWGPLSASAAPLIGDVVLHIGGLSLGCSLLATLGFRPGPREGAERAAQFAAGFAIAVSPAALAAFVDAGAFVPRFTCLPAWREVAPMATYAAFGAALLAALLPIAVAGAHHLRRAAPR
jgi:hypothetical protein